VSAHAPTVQMLYPNGGETLGPEPVTVQWQATDLDQDPLVYSVLYSADGGQSWQTVATEWITPAIQIPAMGLPGSEKALFRVIASDGVNTGQDQSDAVFTVLRKPPQAMITSPSAKADINSDQQVTLVGIGYDVEDGLLPDSAFVWSSDLQGTLGAGAHAAVRLKAGVHNITLTVKDSDGQTGSDTVQITIGEGEGWPAGIALPVLLKAR
jgi:hypothetical protein